MTAMHRVLWRSAPEALLSALEALEKVCFAQPWDAHALASLLENPAGRLDILETAAGELLCYALWQQTADEAELLRLATAPEVRRQGYAAGLLRTSLAQMQREGTAAFWLDVRVSNEAARTLYHSLGFQSMGVRRRYYRAPEEDAAVLCFRPEDGDQKEKDRA